MFLILAHHVIVGHIRATALSASFIFIQSGCRESDPDCMHPMHAYYHYTTARNLVFIVTRLCLAAKSGDLGHNGRIDAILCVPIADVREFPLFLDDALYYCDHGGV